VLFAALIKTALAGVAPAMLQIMIVIPASNPRHVMTE
jgi:hypothetical protein